MTVLAVDTMSYRPYHLTFACAIPLNAYRKGSLSLSGAILAGIFAVITLVLSPTLVFAASLLVFFFAGSKATKYKANVKAALEESEHEVQTKQLKNSSAAVKTSNDEERSKLKKKDLSSGNRDAYQVACNGLVGTLACLAWLWRFGVSFSYGALEAVPCPISDHTGSNEDMKISNALVFAAVGFWSACMGDTLASELGMLAKTRPRLITSGKPVPPGTNGGVTAWGTFVSAAGGAFIALTALLVLMFENNTCTLSLDNASSSIKFATLFIGMGTFAGLFGSLLDSLLGATLQETLYSEATKRIVHTKSTGSKDKVIRIQGRAILSNNGVNAVSTTITALLCGWIGWHI